MPRTWTSSDAFQTDGTLRSTSTHMPMSCLLRSHRIAHTPLAISNRSAVWHPWHSEKQLTPLFNEPCPLSGASLRTYVLVLVTPWVQFSHRRSTPFP